ncbi:tetratricopeptide repeat protein [Thalassotalea ganghwensis]
MVDKSYKYKAFISYSHSDEKWAKWLHNKLESYGIHKHLIGQETSAGVIPTSLAPVFLDREELASATDLGTMLTDCLDNAWCQIVICSPKAAQSHWVNEEIKTFKRLGKANRIFSLIVDGEPYASNSEFPDQECFPPALRYQLDEQGELSDLPAEPIAADARKGKDGKSNALLKIIAGMLGVGFDALKQRELQRRQRRMMAISFATTCGMIFAIGLAVTALIARDEAELQRERAEVEAQKAMETADFMVSLFSVSDPSEARGNTVTAREILDNGAQRIEHELSDKPLIQSTLMNTIGQVYTALGLYQQASPLLEKTLSHRRKLYQEQRIAVTDLANSMEGLANVYTETADYEQALQLYLDALALPESIALTQKVSLQAGLAEIYFRLGKYVEAEPLLTEVLAQQTALFGEQSMQASQALQQLGLNMFDQGKYEQAEQYLTASLTRFKQIFVQAPHPVLAENIANLALLYEYTGNYKKAQQYYDEALVMMKALYGEAHPNVASVHMSLAMVLNKNGELTLSEHHNREAITILATVHQGEHPELAKALNNLAFLLKDMGKNQEAEQTIKQAIDMASKTLGEQHSDVAKYMSTYARWLVERFEFEKAIPIHRKALAIKVALTGRMHPSVGISQFDLAEALLGINEVEQAMTLSSEALDTLNQTVGEGHTLIALAQTIKAKVHMIKNETSQAEVLLLSSYDILSQREFVSPSYLRKVLKQLTYLYEQQKLPDKFDKYQQLLSKI